MATDGKRPGGQAERYRKAAELALEQLEWSINYLHQIGRSRIANVLAQNRKTIITRHRLRA